MFRWEWNEIGPGTPPPISASSKPNGLIGEDTEQGWGCEVASLAYSPCMCQWDSWTKSKEHWRYYPEE